uniref:NADAR domain-containing protein n=1 Tax=viral metagenome TaxID=1070528 RepID=A0A6C0H5U0_9ZZZZ
METDSEIYFYGVKNKYGCFSNFYLTFFVDEHNIKYNCSEQYFMYQKCLLFDPTNEKLLKQILRSNIPTNIKKLGRSVKNYDEIAWNDKRYSIMLKGLLLKFSQNDNIKRVLLNTENKTIYEASKYDKIWGIGYNTKEAINVDKDKYGKNLLGNALMEIRNMVK